MGKLPHNTFGANLRSLASWPAGGPLHFPLTNRQKKTRAKTAIFGQSVAIFGFWLANPPFEAFAVLEIACELYWASRFCCKNLEGQFWTPGGAISKVRSRVHLGNFRKKNGFQHSIFEPGFEKTGAKLREAVSELRSPTRFLSLFPPLPKSRKANLELRSPDHFALKRPQPKSGFSNRKKFPNLSPYIYDK